MQPFKSTTHHAKIGWKACAQNLCVEIHLMHGKFTSFPGSDVAQRNWDRKASWDEWKAASVNPLHNSTRTAIEKGGQRWKKIEIISFTNTCMILRIACTLPSIRRQTVKNVHGLYANIMKHG